MEILVQFIDGTAVERQSVRIAVIAVIGRAKPITGSPDLPTIPVSRVIAEQDQAGRWSDYIYVEGKRIAMKPGKPGETRGQERVKELIYASLVDLP